MAKTTICKVTTKYGTEEYNTLDDVVLFLLNNKIYDDFTVTIDGEDLTYAVRQCVAWKR
jgi:hypothetical protein